MEKIKKTLQICEHYLDPNWDGGDASAEELLVDVREAIQACGIYSDLVDALANLESYLAPHNDGCGYCDALANAQVILARAKDLK